MPTVEPTFATNLIALKEMRETRYWLCLTEKAGLIEGDTIKDLVKEATKLRAILAKAVATARGKAKPRDEARGSDSARAR